MFRVQLCSSSGGQNCITQHLASSHCWRPCDAQVRRGQPMLLSKSQDQVLHPWAHPVHKQTAWHTLRYCFGHCRCVYYVPISPRISLFFPLSRKGGSNVEVHINEQIDCGFVPRNFGLIDIVNRQSIYSSCHCKRCGSTRSI